VFFYFDQRFFFLSARTWLPKHFTISRRLCIPLALAAFYLAGIVVDAQAGVELNAKPTAMSVKKISNTVVVPAYKEAPNIRFLHENVGYVVFLH
jgi:phosphatidylglycerophosphate synthase